MSDSKGGRAKAALADTQPTLTKANDDEKMRIFSKYAGYVFDLDGTIWKGNSLIPGVAEVIELLRYQGKKVYFVTNNSTLSRKAYLKKFQELGLKASLAEVYGSAYAAAAYLKGKKLQKKVYVVGESGIVDELKNVGIRTVGGPEDADKKFDFSSNPRIVVDNEIGAVVVGLDRNINYYKIQYGLTCLLQNEDCVFLATNTDSRGNLASEQEWAGAGTMVGAMIGATEAEPLVVGKPSSFLLDTICRASGLTREQFCIVGDRLDTDVLWGNRHGCGTVLVLTGVTSEEVLKSPDNKIYPTYYMDSLADMLSIKGKISSSCVIC